MKVYITKYALNRGIQEAEVDYMPEDQSFYGNGKEWHLTIEAAKVRAEQMRLAKIKSLEKQLAKLKALKFL